MSKSHHVPALAIAAPVVFCLRANPGSSVLDLMRLLGMSRSPIQDRIRFLWVKRKIYISGWTYGKDGRGGRAAPLYSAGSSPDVMNKYGRGKITNPTTKKSKADNLVRRDWLQSAFFGYVEPHVSSVYSPVVHVSADNDEELK